MAGLVRDIWNSFNLLPAWAQVWVAVILVPVNLAALAFVTAPMGTWIAFLAVAGIAPNVLVMAMERSFSRTMALPHVVIWAPLVILIVMALTRADVVGGYRTFLLLLLAVDVVSLVFDFRDSWKWWQGDRVVA